MSDLSVIRPQVGLALSIGLPPNSPELGNPGNYPKKIGWFRPKPGSLNQYAAAAEAFAVAYGHEPTVVDVLQVSDDINLVFDVRHKSFGTSGLKALGRRNLAALEPQEFLDSLYAFDEELDIYPDDDGDVTVYKLTGPQDRNVVNGHVKVYGVLRFSIPEVTGLMTLAEISTTSRRSMRNIYAGLQMARQITGGRLVGIPMSLAVRPTKGRYIDPETKKKKSTTYFELVLDSTVSLAALYDALVTRQNVLGAGQRVELPPIEHDSLDRDEELVPARRAIEAATEVPAVNVDTFEQASAATEPGEDAAGNPSPAPSPAAEDPGQGSFFEQHVPASVRS